MTTLVPKTPTVIAGVIFVLVMTMAGIFAPLVAPHDPTEISMLDAQLAPGEDLTYLLEVWPESHWPGFALRQTDVL